MSRKVIGLAVVLLAAGMISGCNQNQQKNAEQKTAQQEPMRAAAGVTGSARFAQTISRNTAQPTSARSAV